MQAVILAAGVGRRMQKNSNDLPKGLIKIAGREIVYRTMTFLKELGVKEFILVTNPFCQPFYKNFAERNGFSCQIIVNSHPERGNGYSLYLAKDHVKGKFILTMSDHVYEKAFLEKAIYAEGIIVDKIGKFIEKTEATKVQIKNGHVIAIGKKIEKWDGFDTGFFILSSEIFKIAEEVVKNKQIVELSEIIEKAKIKATEVSGFFWMDIDTPSDLKNAKRAILQNAIKGTGDGFISKYFNRKISTKISEHIASFATPNQITIFSFLVGIFSAFIAFFHPVWGGIVYQFSSILDGTDGEIARASLQESKFGGWFDSLLDRFVDFSFLLALGLKINSSFWPVVAFAIFGTVMVSYSTERFKAAYQKDAYKEISALRYLVGKRDERIFLTMLFCLLGKIKMLFILLAILTNLRVLLTIYLVWLYEKPKRTKRIYYPIQSKIA